jgi:hypothetical protein
VILNLYGKMISVVTTTINVPYFLEDYIIHHIEQYTSNNELTFIIIGDLKSPHKAIKEYLQRISSHLMIEYWDVKSQKKWISETFGGKAMKVEKKYPIQ